LSRAAEREEARLLGLSSRTGLAAVAGTSLRESSCCPRPPIGAWYGWLTKWNLNRWVSGSCAPGQRQLMPSYNGQVSTCEEFYG
jgi:hypothetical protein